MPVPVWKVPALHRTQTEAPDSAWKEPAWHEAQAACEVMPVPVEKVPAVQARLMTGVYVSMRLAAKMPATSAPINARL
jgi:hypothetical protein